MEDEPYYHGFMSLDECKTLLINPGDFLVRKGELADNDYIISVLCESKKIENYPLKRTRVVRFVQLTNTEKMCSVR